MTHSELVSKLIDTKVVDQFLPEPADLIKIYDLLEDLILRDVSSTCFHTIHLTILVLVIASCCRYLIWLCYFGLCSNRSRHPSLFAWRPDALLAVFQDAKSFSTFIGLAGLFIYQSKVRVGFIAWFLKTGEISDQVQPKVSHHRVSLLALRNGQTRQSWLSFFLASLSFLPEPVLQRQIVRERI